MSEAKTIKRIISGAVASILIFPYAAANSADDQVLDIAWSGGIVGELEKEIFLPTFEQETGWSAEMKSSELGLLPQLESMVKTGHTYWDIAELSGGKYDIAVSKGLLEPIDYSRVDPDGTLPEAARKKYGVAWGSYSTVLVQRTDKNPKGKTMESWKDFWDVETFPGPRSLRARPQYNLEFALLADGVPKDKVYEVLATEEGVNRALDKLGELKPHIPVWWENGAQSVQLLTDGEVYYSTTFNGRVTKLKENQIPVDIVWNGGALHVALMGIPKGSPDVDASHEYLRIRAMRPDLQREYIRNIAYPGFAPGLFEGVSEDVVATMPTSSENVSKQFVSDSTFWQENIDWIQERWNEWLLQ